jgi:putative aldouronate transport system permease protein
MSTVKSSMQNLSYLKSQSFKNYMQRHWELYLMLVPPIAFFLIFSYTPMINLLIAFMTNNIIRPVWENTANRWVGFANFQRAFSNPQFITAVNNTIRFSVLDLVVGFPPPIILALLLNEIKFKKFKRITQTISYMPFFLSWIIVAGMAIRLFSSNEGAITQIIYGFTGTRIPFLRSPVHWTWTNVLISLWRFLGWNTIIYLAAITGVNPELYDAADVDGAGRIRKMWHVTLPGIRHVIVILLILTIGQIMSTDLARFLALENNLVRERSMVLPMFVYNWGIQGAQFNLAAAVGLFASMLNLVFLFTANYIAKKVIGSGLW